MNIQTLSEKIGDFGKDIRLNLQSVSTAEGAPGLTAEQRVGIALSTAYALGDSEIIEAVMNEYSPSATVIEASKSAATIMAMNNIYYRFLHLTDDKEFSTMPAKLRMNIIGKPPVAKVDFELMSLAVSAISGCGKCMNAHIHEVKKAGISNEGIQSAVRIASVMNAAKTALSIS
jgi:alkyl hydroperoxide reductase subunit D